jgi:hypothetical protein
LKKIQKSLGLPQGFFDMFYLQKNSKVVKFMTTTIIAMRKLAADLK